MNHVIAKEQREKEVDESTAENKNKIRDDDSIVFATVNYGPMIEAAIMYDFVLDDSNQEDTRYDL